MKRMVRTLLAATLLVSGYILASAIPTVFAADDDQAVLQADRALAEAIGKADKTAVGKLLDANFAWTAAQGKTKNKAQVLQALPTAALGDESGFDVAERTHRQGCA